MIAVYILIGVALVGLAVYFVIKETKFSSHVENMCSHAVEKNKKAINNMVANVESIIVYANGNDVLCRRLVEVKDNIRFFNPTSDSKVELIDTKIANRLDDLKIMVAKDNTQETCFRVLEEIEAFIVQRKKDEQKS